MISLAMVELTPIFGIIGFFASVIILVYMFFSSRHKIRMALIENDKDMSIFNQMKSGFFALKSVHRSLAAYDAWFKHPLNNAQLISVSTYHDWVPAFGKILVESEGDLNTFYRTCRKLAKKEPTERLRILMQYTDH